MKKYNVTVDHKLNDDYLTTFVISAENIKDAREKAQLHKRREFPKGGRVNVHLNK